MRIAILGIRGIPANYGGFETFAEQLSGDETIRSCSPDLCLGDGRQRGRVPSRMCNRRQPGD